MKVIFCGCKNLDNIDISFFNIENVIDMSEMFLGCEHLKHLNIYSIENVESNITNMADMFENG